MDDYNSEVSEEEQDEDMKSYGSSRKANLESHGSPHGNNQMADSPETDGHVNIESSPEGAQQWSLNQNYAPGKEQQDLENDDDGYEVEDNQNKSLSERDKKILQEFRDVAPENEDRRNDHDRHQDFKTGSFNKGQAPPQGEGPYYSEAFSFSKD